MRAPFGVIGTAARGSGCRCRQALPDRAHEPRGEEDGDEYFAVSDIQRGKGKVLSRSAARPDLVPRHMPENDGH